MIVDELAQYLDREGFGTYDLTGVANDIFLEFMLDSPDDAIGLYSTGGLQADISTSVSRPGVQIIVRGADAQQTSQRAMNIHQNLHGKRDFYFVVGGTRIMLCACRQSEPIGLGLDENNRSEFSINLQFITGGI